MNATVCILANTIHYPFGGGHFWAYLNWVLGLRAIGCKIIWMERVHLHGKEHQTQKSISILRQRLLNYGLGNNLALFSWSGEPLPFNIMNNCLDSETAAAESDLLINMVNETPLKIVKQFKRTALIDLDPGILQYWMNAGVLKVAPHDIYWTVGENVGVSKAASSNSDIEWHYTPPCVALDYWNVSNAPVDAPFTTVSHWYMDEWMIDESGNEYKNDKRSSFLPFLDLPQLTQQHFELAICLNDDVEERNMLEEKGWRVRESWEVSSSPQDYQHYIQNSRGEFGCAKPAYVCLQTGWLSDRTICYLASGKPVLVQYTGPSRFLPDNAGIFRFRSITDAVQFMEVINSEYDLQSKLARKLAEEYFDAARVLRRVLELSIV